MDPPELASEPPRSHIGAASNSALHLRVLGGVMLGLQWSLMGFYTFHSGAFCFLFQNFQERKSLE
jgi:hypothetical protein